MFVGQLFNVGIWLIKGVSELSATLIYSGRFDTALAMIPDDLLFESE